MERLTTGYIYIVRGHIEPVSLFDSARITNLEGGKRITIHWRCRLREAQWVNGEAKNIQPGPVEDRQFHIYRVGQDYVPKSERIWLEGVEICSAPWVHFRGTFDTFRGYGELRILSPAHCKPCRIDTAFGRSGSFCSECGSMLTDGHLPAEEP